MICSGDSYYPDWIHFLVDLLSSELVPRVLRLINTCLSSSNSSITEEVLESKPETMFWLRMMESIRDPYITERISEQILHKLASQQANDVQAYWVLWLFFHRIFRLQASVRWVKVLVSVAFIHRSSWTNPPFWFEKKTDDFVAWTEKWCEKRWFNFFLSFHDRFTLH